MFSLGSTQAESVFIQQCPAVLVAEQIASLGSNLLMITPGQRLGPGQRSVAAAFDLDDAKAIAREISSIVAVVPASSKSTTAVFGNENWSTRVTGIVTIAFLFSVAGGA